MVRPSWSGQIQISLVSFGVKLFPATNAASRISFHEVDRESGERVRHQKVVEGGESVERAQVVKGYEYSKGQYITLEPEEIEKVRLPSKHTLAITQFVNAGDVDRAFFDKPYFVVPEDDLQMQAFSVVRKALQQTGKMGLGEVAFGGREHLVAIMPPGDAASPGLMAYTMRYAEELRNSAEYFSSIKDEAIRADQLSLAKELIRRNTRKFDPESFTDDYEAALRELVDSKLEHKPLPREEKRSSPGKVINLMDALRKSVDGQEGKADRKPAARTTGSGETAKSSSSKSASPAKGIGLVKPASNRRKSA